jgi:hypothetical protein
VKEKCNSTSGAEAEKSESERDKESAITCFNSLEQQEIRFCFGLVTAHSLEITTHVPWQLLFNT